MRDIQLSLKKIHSREIKKIKTAETPNTVTKQQITQSTMKFQCVICNEPFVWRKNWLAHNRNFHAKKIATFKCTRCGNFFSSISNLRSHWIQKHPRSKLPNKEQCQQIVNNTKKGKLGYTALEFFSIVRVPHS